MDWLIITGVLLLILSIASPFFGLINYMILLYLRPAEVYPEIFAPFHVARIFALFVILGYLFKRRPEKNVFFNYRQDKILFALLIVIVLSFSVGWVQQCIKVLEQMAKNVIVYGLIVGLVSSERRLKILLWALLIMSAIMGYNTFLAYKALDPAVQQFKRIGGFSGGYFGGAGDFAVMLNTAIPMGFFLGIGGRPVIFRPVALLLTAACIAGMVSTLARGGVIAFGAIMLGVAIFGIKSKGTFKKFLSIFLVVGSIGCVVAFAPSAFKERAASIGDYSHQGTATARIEYWKLGIKMFLSNPLIGVGAGNYPVRYWDFGGWERQWRVSHNMYIEALSELGILGFSCLFLLLYYTFKDGFSAINLLREHEKANTFLYSATQAVILSLVGYCVGGMFQSIFTYPIFYMIIGLVVAAKNIALESAQEKI